MLIYKETHLLLNTEITQKPYKIKEGTYFRTYCIICYVLMIIYLFSLMSSCACMWVFICVLSVCLCVGIFLHFSHYPLTLLVSDLNVSLILAPACTLL